jgi:hypothetical protein
VSFTEVWGERSNQDLIDELAAPGIGFSCSIHASENGLIAEEKDLDDGVKMLNQAALIPQSKPVGDHY